MQTHSSFRDGDPPATKPKKIQAVDLFCGIGGLTYGLRLAGISVRAGYDIDPSCRYAYEANNKQSLFVEADIRSIRFQDVEPPYGDAKIKVMVGCAPCQPFSAHTRRRKNQDDDCSLLDEFTRLIKEGTPDIISIENVPGLARHEAFGRLLDTLQVNHYNVDHSVVSCLGYGVPQDRRRLVLVASRIGNISLPSLRNQRKTVEDFIRNTPVLEAGKSDDSDRAHITMPLSDLNFRRIRQSKPGGTWRDWDEDLISNCHNKTYYPAPYGRMRWNAPAPTITTQFCYYSTGRFGHPEQHRAISVREAALLQTFPAKYDLVDPDEPLLIHKVARHVGNAVPVALAQAIGGSIMEAADVG